LISKSPRNGPYRPRTAGPRPHPAASVPRSQYPTSREPVHSTARVKPQTLEEAKLNLRMAAAQRNERASGHGGNDLASTAIQFVKDHPVALAAGVGVLALVIGPGALLKGAATVARVGAVAGFLGKAAK